MLSTIKRISTLISLVSLVFLVSLLITKANAYTVGTGDQNIIVTNIIKPTFNYDLQVGSVGDDVFKLQRFLNADENTAVSFSGVGSRGYETTNFGGLTKSAVIKFQNKYSLIPADGYVGLNTRQKLNELYPKTDFNKPYTKTYTTIPNQTTISNTKPKEETSLCQLIDTLILINIIPKEKAAQAKSIVTGCTTTNTSVSTSTSPAPWKSTSTAPTYNNQNLYNNNNTTSSSTIPYSIYNPTYNYYTTGVTPSVSPSSTGFEGNKSLGLIRSYAVFAGEDLKNINTNSTSSPINPNIKAATAAVGPDRTIITGDVGAKTEKDIPLSISGQNSFGLASQPMVLSALNQATAKINSSSCNFSAGPETTELGGRTLEPGTYCFSGDIKITGTVTLGSKGTYVFRTTKGISTYYSSASSTSIITNSTSTLHNPRKPLVESVKFGSPNEGFDPQTGLPPYNVFWVASEDVKIADNTIFLGTVMANTANIEVGEWAEIPQGRLLTRGSISLNKNLIAIPPDPIKLTVKIKGKSTGTVSGPDFVCSTKKGQTSASTNSSSSTSSGGNNATCYTYYESGQDITLTASPTSSENPTWKGCDGANSNGKTCPIKIKDEREVEVEFFLDPFRGFLLGTWGTCIDDPTFVLTVAGSNGGTFATKNLEIGGKQVIGTLKDEETKSCKGYGNLRVINEIGSM